MKLGMRRRRGGGEERRGRNILIPNKCVYVRILLNKLEAEANQILTDL